jgi:hypothetical protein
VSFSAKLRWAGALCANGSQAAIARWYSWRCSAPASCILIEMAECSFSQMRGTPRNMVGPTSRRSSCTVRIDSPKSTREPRYSGTKVVSICSATWHSGRYDRCDVSWSRPRRSMTPGAIAAMLP